MKDKVIPRIWFLNGLDKSPHHVILRTSSIFLWTRRGRHQVLETGCFIPLNTKIGETALPWQESCGALEMVESSVHKFSAVANELEAGAGKTVIAYGINV
jgi:hypothetical protein